MAVYTYTYTDCGLDPLAAYHPTLEFTLSGESFALDGGRMLSTRPVLSVPDSAGRGSVELVPNDEILGATTYMITATYLDEAGGMSRIDIFEIFARAGGGPITDMAPAGESWAPAQLIVSDYEPDPWPIGWAWASELTGDVFLRSA